MGATLMKHSGAGGMIARIMGKVFVALGFIVGIYGLTEAQPAVLQTGLGLLVGGILASAYGLFHPLHPHAPSQQDPGDHERLPKL
jgi:hypothetical protein